MSELPSLLVLLALAACCHGYGFYPARLPNVGSTSKIPAPIAIVGTAGQTCRSIGHAAQCGGSPSGSGNPFGKAFNNGGGTWTKAVCMADSDSDGFTNGQELGDPQCLWAVGSNVALATIGLSHPGFACSTPTNPYCMTGTGSQASTSAQPMTTASPTTAQGQGAPAATTQGQAGNFIPSSSTEDGPKWEYAVTFAVLIMAVKFSLIVVNDRLTARRTKYSESFQRQGSSFGLTSDGKPVPVAAVNEGFQGEAEISKEKEANA